MMIDELIQNLPLGVKKEMKYAIAATPGWWCAAVVPIVMIQALQVVFIVNQRVVDE